MIKPQTWLGVDRNATGHVAVVANPQTGKVWKLCKKQNIYTINTGKSGGSFRKQRNTSC